MPQVADIAEWPDMRICAFVRFCDLFTDDRGVFFVTEERVRVASEAQEDYWQEFLSRIDYLDKSNAKFRNRLQSLYRVVAMWLQANPHAITEDMRAVMGKSPKFRKVLTSFTEVQTTMGTEAIEVKPNEKGELTTPQAIFNQSLLNASTALLELTSSFKRGELRSMSPKDKLNAANALIGSLGKMFQKTAPQSVTFQKIVVNKASREDLEAALVAHSDTSNEEE